MDEHSTWTIRDGLMAFALVIVASGVATVALMLIFGVAEAAEDAQLAVLGVGGTAIGMVCGLVYARTKAPASALSLRPCPQVWMLYAVAMVVPVLAFGYGWSSAIEWFGWEIAPQSYVEALLSSSDPMTLVVAGTYGVLGAAIFEELLFRGIIQPPMVARWGVWPGVLAQGMLFGMMHMVDAWAILPTAIIGCVAGWLRIRSGGLGAPILFHAVNNLLALLLNAAML